MLNQIVRIAAVAAFGCLVFATSSALASTRGWMSIKKHTTLTTTHYGTISIDAPYITLDCGGHTIKPGDSYTTGIQVVGQHSVTIKGCHITNYKSGAKNGIKIQDSNYVYISDSEIRNMEENGTYIYDANNISIHGYEAHNNGKDGILADNVDSLYMYDSSLHENSSDGAESRYSYGVHFQNVDIYANNVNGFLFQNCGFTFVENGVVFWNGASGIKGIEPYDETLLYGPTASGNGGSGVEISSRLNIQTPQLYAIERVVANNNTVDGISLSRIENANVYDCVGHGNQIDFVSNCVSNADYDENDFGDAYVHCN